MTTLARTTFKCLLFAFVFALGGLSVVAQDSAATFDCSIAEKLTRPARRKMVSFGVLNGKAITLIRPSYPAAARAVNVRGAVVVSVVINNRGCVAEATAVSGHPLLKSASLTAALRSSFEPVLLSGQPVWFYGVIMYNFTTDNANWLEIGFDSGTLESLAKYLPVGFEGYRQELEAAESLPFDERQKALDDTIEKIRTEVIVHPRGLWLFDLGRKLRSISKYDFEGADGLTGATKELKTLVETAPTTVSPQLIVQLNQLIKASPTPAFWTHLKEIEVRMFHFGN